MVETELLRMVDKMPASQCAGYAFLWGVVRTLTNMVRLKGEWIVSVLLCWSAAGQ